MAGRNGNAVFLLALVASAVGAQGVRVSPGACFLDKGASRSFATKWTPTCEPAGIQLSAIWRYGRAIEALKHPNCIGGLLLYPDTQACDGNTPSQPSLFILSRRYKGIAFTSVLWSSDVGLRDKIELYQRVRSAVSCSSTC